MPLDELIKEMNVYDQTLDEYMHMVDFGPLVSDFTEAVLVKTRSEEDDIRFSCARALGRVTGMLPGILCIQDIEERKKRLIQLTKEYKNE